MSLINRYVFLFSRRLPRRFRMAMDRIYYSWLGLVHFFRYGTIDMFETVQIETNSTCNRSCGYCPNSVSRRPERALSHGDIVKVLNELKEMNFKGVFVFSGYNEPLLDSRLREIVELTRSLFPANRIVIYTNGDYLDGRWVETADRLNLKFNVTLHGGDRNGENQARLLGGIPAEMKKHINVKKEITRTALSTRGGLVEVPVRLRRYVCNVPASELTIMSDGNVVLCSDDFNSEIVFGNIRDSSIPAIWYSEKYRRIRRELRKGIFTLPICRNCAD